MEIDPQLPIPLYFQLKTLLLEEILSGRYDREERLPTEHELCDRYRISRTPVTRALSELADEGVILRHRRRGSFVNPHWLSRRPDQTEIRVIVPTGGPWARMVRDAAAGSNQISVVQVPGHALHHTLTHAVAEGLAPDIALLDNVWAPEFAAAGFISRARGPERELGRRRTRGRLSRSSRTREPVRRHGPRRLALRRRRGSLVSARRPRIAGPRAPATWNRPPYRRPCLRGGRCGAR